MAAATSSNLNVKINMSNGITNSAPSSRGGRMGVTVQNSGNNNSGTGPSSSNANNIPLSARKSAGLDLKSVERRGESNPPQRREAKSSRPHGLQEAPTFRPTEEEFRAGPIEYIKKIAPEGRKYGIVKIVPPAGWTPPFAIDTEQFHFRTRKQELNQTDGGTRANLNYLDQLAKFHKQRSGTTLNRFPSVDKRPLDLYKLKKFVEDKGGFDNVCKGKRWAEIGRDLGYSGKIMSSLSTSLKNSYMKWLMPYEDWLKQNKPSVLQQQEREHGGPYTPSPSNTPAKSTNNSPVPLASAVPVMKASIALSASLQNGPESASKPVETPPRPSPGFRPVNAGGFIAVNAPQPSGFAAVNMPNGHTNGTATPSSIVNTTDSRALVNGVEHEDGVVNGVHSALKRQHSAEDSSANDDDSSGRRSKRLKKENSAPTVTGSHMIQPRIPGPAPMFVVPRDRSNDRPGDCDVCGKGSEAGSTLVCDSCDLAYHPGCLEPPLKSQTESDWHCPRCLVGTGEFGFQEGGIYSLKSFQEKALRFKERYFAKKYSVDPVSKNFEVPEEEVELEFWRLTESLTETVEVEYGADIHSTTHGSGFPTIEREPFSEYSTHIWNLNVMPLDKDSLFRHIKTDISGMTVPWLYVGMCFSTFCWHNEDHYTYSANYQHFGDTKTWYGIPSSSAERFEEAMKEAVPELFEQQPDLLFQLVTLLQPDKLRKANVQVFALDQHAGEFVITFPQAYHAGFNHGFNFNEAVNFAPADWEPFGGSAVQRLQIFRRQPVFSHDELLFSAAARDHSIKTAKWLGSALRRVMDHEFQLREDFKAEYNQARSQLVNGSTEQSLAVEDPPFTSDVKDYADEETVCAYCKAYGFLSRFNCRINGKVLCLTHAGKYDCCSSSTADRLALTDGNHELQYRHTNEEVESIVQRVMDTAKTPDLWHEKLDALLEEGPKPTLRSLRALVTEGEKIDSSWSLPELHDLKEFVTKCNVWVEEAMSYIARKPNRRKSESRYRGPDESKKKAGEDNKKNALRNPDNVQRLLKVADTLSFDCPELEKLQERYERIVEFKHRARSALKLPHVPGQDLEALIEEGHDLDMDIPEMNSLEKKARTVKWFANATDHSDKMSQGSPLSLDEVKEFIELGKSLEITDENEYMRYFRGQVEQGEFWESKAHQVMSVENVNFQQLDALFKQASRLPVSRSTLAQIDEMLKKQREAEEIVMILYERTKDPDFRKRPMYKGVRETMERLSDLNIKPPGTLDLEKEQKRHEDWMRKGKKLFGKANAPLHILMQHMQYVHDRNEACLDLTDQPRMPVEPASREASPTPNYADGSSSSSNVFCVCRKPESGMMIECELCHEWYHTKCFKIARGKVKEDDKYTCPICDYRVKIPRDASRPKLEDLQAWQDEILTLPFQPEEEDLLSKIIDTSQEFRNYIAGTVMANHSTLSSTPDDLPVQRFYLRKIEGAEVLLVDETNFLRRELHKWAPVAPEPPEMITASKSTRKPRPTKAERMAAMFQCDVQDLPFEMQPRHIRKALRQEAQKNGVTLDPSAWRRREDESASPKSAKASSFLPTKLSESAEPSSVAQHSQTSPVPQFGSSIRSQHQPSGSATGSHSLENEKDPLGAFDPALMGPSPPRHFESASPVFAPSDSGPYRTGQVSSAMHFASSHVPDDRDVDDGHSPLVTQAQTLGAEHDDDDHGAVDPQLEIMFAAQAASTEGGGREEDEGVEEMFGSLTNGGGEDEEFEFGHPREEEREANGGAEETGDGY